MWLWLVSSVKTVNNLLALTNITIILEKIPVCTYIEFSVIMLSTTKSKCLLLKPSHLHYKTGPLENWAAHTWCNCLESLPQVSDQWQRASVDTWLAAQLLILAVVSYRQTSASLLYNSFLALVHSYRFLCLNFQSCLLYAMVCSVMIIFRMDI